MSLQLSEDGRRVQIVVEPKPDATMIAPADVVKLLQDGGYGAWLHNKDAITKLPKLARDAKETLHVDVAEKREAQLSLKVAKDEMSATLTIVPPQGGAPVTEQDIKVLMDRERVVHGILPDAIASAIQAQRADALPVAQGTAPIPGDDTKFQTLLPEITDRRPKVNEDGTVDYREIGVFFTVHPGTALMTRVPFTNGVAGTTVFGTVVPPKPGRDIPFAPALAGARLDDANRDQLIAAIGGQPILVDHGVRVEPVINLKTVDLESGNIDFDGTVNVAGDVVAGLKIVSTGDIQIAGMVEGAILEAGGHINIAKGVIGRGELRNPDGTPASGIAQIRAGGSIHARFIENAIVNCTGDLYVDELLAHSDVCAEGVVVVGKPKAKKGHIMGGNVTATHGIKALIAGSSSGVKTKLEAGLSRAVRASIEGLRGELAAKTAEREKLTALLAKANQIPKPLAERARTTLLSNEQEIARLTEERDKLQAQLQQDSTARIALTVTTFEGTTIQLGELKLDVTREHAPGFFSLVEGQIVYTPE
jgi:uncharacterized protein (DUF342 family)